MSSTVLSSQDLVMAEKIRNIKVIVKSFTFIVRQNLHEINVSLKSQLSCSYQKEPSTIRQFNDSFLLYTNVKHEVLKKNPLANR